MKPIEVNVGSDKIIEFPSRMFRKKDLKGMQLDFIAEVYVNGKKHAVWEGNVGGHMVRKINTPLIDCVGTD